MKYALLKLIIKLKDDKVVNMTTSVWSAFDADSMDEAENLIKEKFNFAKEGKYELERGLGLWEKKSYDNDKDDVEIIHQFRIVYMGENVTFRF